MTLTLDKGAGGVTAVKNPGGMHRESPELQATIARCLKRMQCWMVVAISIYQAEMPKFELVNFGFFDAHSSLRQKPGENLERLRILARAFGLNEGMLVCEFTRVAAQLQRGSDHDDCAGAMEQGSPRVGG